jgi:hypothetical protein
MTSEALVCWINTVTKPVVTTARSHDPRDFVGNLVGAFARVGTVMESV